MDVLAGILGVVLVSAIPGHLLTSRDLPAGTSAPERWAFALGLGFWSVTFLASVVWCLPIHRLGLWYPAIVVPACSLIVSLPAWVRWRRRPAIEPHPPSRSDWLLLGLAAVVFILFFFGVDDEHFTSGCLYRSLRALARQSPFEALPILRVNGDERFGNVAAVWMIQSLVPAAFERTGHGLFTALLFLTSAALGRRLTGQHWPGVVGSFALILTDDVFGFEVLNQNLIAAFTVTLLAICLLHERHPFRSIMFTFLAAMLVSSRYVAVFGIGAWLAVVIEGDGPRRVRLGRVLSLGAMGLVFLAPTLTLLATGGARMDEVLPHRVLNFPFHGDLVRTPMLPFPMWIGWLLHFLGTWGWLGATLVLSGWMFLWRDRRRFANVLALYAVPVALFLFAQENWIEPEKMSIGLIFAPLAVAGISAALDRLASSRGRVVLGTVGAAGVALALVWFAGREMLPGIPFPEDDRVRAFYPGLPSETPDLMEFERERALAWRFLPAPRSAGILRSPSRKTRDVGRVLRSLTDADRNPSVRELAVWFLDETIFNRSRVEDAIAPPKGEAVVSTRPLILDLTSRPMLAARPLVAGRPGESHAAVLDLSDGRDCAMSPVEGWRVQYLDRPLRILVCHRSGEGFIFLAPPRVPTLEPDEVPPPGVPDSWILTKNANLESRPLADRVSMLLPASVERVTLVDVLYVEPTRYYARTADLRPGGSIEVGPPWVWHGN